MDGSLTTNVRASRRSERTNLSVSQLFSAASTLGMIAVDQGGLCSAYASWRSGGPDGADG